MKSGAYLSGELVISCRTVHRRYEVCNEDAELPFKNILDRPIGNDPSVTDTS
jgi:hypothetical protein